MEVGSCPLFALIVKCNCLTTTYHLLELALVAHMLIIRQENLWPIYDDVYRHWLLAAYNYPDNVYCLRSI